MLVGITAYRLACTAIVLMRNPDWHLQLPSRVAHLTLCSQQGEV